MADTQRTQNVVKLMKEYIEQLEQSGELERLLEQSRAPGDNDLELAEHYSRDRRYTLRRIRARGA
ncbi:hypothetical protein O5O45_16250 [Hahella aquimaris]|uniref:hypothetical protein n=1 Tax=Hahella sp. HNIBRBA332 TaxID=3015983 RepID=UPI00273CDCCE|nr:hypothetical protein [Hahella sp. HNIBRBA332]WLQ11298.1 hypothetical protein O5O45_16250 [Hahella sp. HNIBRBA332]